jgi:hypothetical protein
MMSYDEKMREKDRVVVGWGESNDIMKEVVNSCTVG